MSYDVFPYEMLVKKSQRQLDYLAWTYHLRMLGLAFGLLPVAAVLYELHGAIWQWALIISYTLVWPHVARAIAQYVGSPFRAELRSVLVDVTLAGFWVAMIQFNAVPSMSILMVIGIALVSSGGWRMMTYGLPALVIGCLAEILLRGFAWHPDTNYRVLLADIPLLVVYPVVISAATYRLARRVSKQNHLLGQLSRTDSLTSLPNRRHWQQSLTLEFQRYLRTHRPATLVMIDLDGFKSLNDTYGHTVGDDVLRRVASILRKNCRNIDTPGRFGGDEFGLVMPETDGSGACVLLERIRKEVEYENCASKNSLRVTVSIGFAEIHCSMSNPLDWIKAADDALYLAKERGRNRICMANASLSSPDADH